MTDDDDDPSEMEREMNAFRDWMEDNNLSDDTIHNYAAWVSRLDDPLQPDDEPAEDLLHKLQALVTKAPYRAAFKKYLKYKKQTGEYSIDTRRTISFLEDELDDLDVSTGDGLDKDEVIAKYLTIEQVRELHRHLDGNISASTFSTLPQPERKAHEFKLMPVFLLETAARIAEALQVRVSDIDQDERRIKLRGKGRGQKAKVRMVNADHSFDALTALIDRYDVDGEVFSFDRGDDYWKIRYELIKAGNELFGADVTPHWFRHSYATNWAIKEIDKGRSEADVKEEIRQYLGHEDLSTTEVYIHAARELDRENIYDAHGGFDL